MKRFAILLLLAGWYFPAAAEMGDWMPFEMVDGELVVRAEIEGVATKASLATDLIVTSINESFLKRHAIPYNKKGNINITFMGSDLELWQPPYYEDETEIGMRVYPWFKVMPIRQVDFTQNRVRFLPSKSAKLYRKDNVKIKGGTVTSGNPAGRIEIGNKTYYVAMLEPRASFTTVSRDLAIEAGWLENYQINPSKLGQMATGLEDYDVMQVPDVKLGPYEFEYAIIIAHKASKHDDRIVTNLDNAASETRFYDGVLGLDILQNFMLTYDPARRKMHVFAP